MVKVFTLFGNPADRAVFDEYFEVNHCPLLVEVPNVARLTVNKIAGAGRGDSPFYLIVELYFASEEAMQEALNSEAGQAMARDLGRFASGGVTVLFSQDTTQQLGSHPNHPQSRTSPMQPER